VSIVDRLLPPIAMEGPDGLVRPSRMQHQERVATVVLGGANAVVCIGLLATLPARETDDNQARVLLLLLGLGVVASLGCVVAARIGNRLVSGMAILAAGFLGPGSALSPFFVIPHYGVAMWMVLRQNRLVKEQAAQRRQMRLARGGTRAPAAATPTGRRGRRRPPTLPDGRLAPPPSKRYTPPRPKKRPLPPAEDKAKKAKAERD